jgi:hypothetical protein
LRDACVATGMNMGRGTRPWGRVRVAARALVVYESQLVGGLRSGVAQLCTEQRAERSNVRAVGISAEEPIFAFGRSWGMHWCRVKRYLER